jgi:hypothetical protein
MESSSSENVVGSVRDVALIEVLRRLFGAMLKLGDLWAVRGIQRDLDRFNMVVDTKVIHDRRQTP